jgi:UDP-N-acetylmuramoyl-L-alanyl-D-glutamate--2,6-diaminopimelate ligase
MGVSIMLKPNTASILEVLIKFDIVITNKNHLKSYAGNLHNDSRNVAEGDIFCAVIGHSQDGRNYITQALNQGAKCILCECENQSEHGKCLSAFEAGDALVINFYQLNQQLFKLTRAYYQNPQEKLTVIGITGTNGKTTTSQLTAQMLTANQSPCAIIGTNGAGGIDKLQVIDNTTPGACQLHQLFTQFNEQDFSFVAMEVSSHALTQKRVQAELFDIAIFTNLSRDHIDYHGSMERYGQAKKQIFTGDDKQIAIINFDDLLAQQWYLVWPKNQKVWLYGRTQSVASSKCYVLAKNVSQHNQGVSFLLVTHVGQVQIESPLLGDFNIDNLLAAISVLLIQGTLIVAIPALVSSITAVAGRMETNSAEYLPTTVVDYAHTPDALDKALTACRQHCTGKLYVVFGCGGDRDKGKRPLMANVAAEKADFIVVTNDNPRSEDAEQIVQDILNGFNQIDKNQVSVILDREVAVLSTLKSAKADDMVLLAGKGHEDYIIVPKYNEYGAVIGTQNIAYDERAIVSKFYQEYQHNIANTPSNVEAKL